MKVHIFLHRDLYLLHKYYIFKIFTLYSVQFIVHQLFKNYFDT